MYKTFDQMMEGRGGVTCKREGRLKCIEQQQKQKQQPERRAEGERAQCKEGY